MSSADRSASCSLRIQTAVTAPKPASTSSTLTAVTCGEAFFVSTLVPFGCWKGRLRSGAERLGAQHRNVCRQAEGLQQGFGFVVRVTRKSPHCCSTAITFSRVCNDPAADLRLPEVKLDLLPEFVPLAMLIPRAS